MLERSRIVKRYPYPLKHKIYSARNRFYGLYDMTICIAALTADREIVMISDMRTDIDMSSTTARVDESVYKYYPFHQEWSALMAGDLSNCYDIILLARKLFEGKGNTLDNARASLKEAYRQFREQATTDAILSPYGLTMREFVDFGLQKFGVTEHGRLCHEIEDRILDDQLLACGFDGDGKPHLFTVDDGRGLTVHLRDLPGFWAIGSGMDYADHLLASAGQNVSKGLPETIRNVCAAKFAAELDPAGTVGRATYFYIKKYQHYAFTAPASLMHEIRAAWDREGRPSASPGILGLISGYCDDGRVRFFPIPESSSPIEPARLP